MKRLINRKGTNIIAPEGIHQWVALIVMYLVANPYIFYSITIGIGYLCYRGIKSFKREKK